MLLQPQSVYLKRDDRKAQLLVAGQGVVLFRETTFAPCTLSFYDNDYSDGLMVEWTAEKVVVTHIKTQEHFMDPTQTSGLVPLPGAYYWVSLDAHNMRMRAGVGEARTETIVFEYTWTEESWKPFLESLTRVECLSSEIVLMKLLRDPITHPVSAIVKDNITMDDIAKDTYLPRAALAPAGQELYGCISGDAFKLDTDDFPEFVQAIENSIRSPDGWCFKKLKEKSTEFSKDKPNFDETYLRITLGENTGESPGIPYVMEIWPVGHYSPIHNHSAAHAIIRVLQGEIEVSQYPFLCGSTDGVEPFVVTHFYKDQITWISPTQNQTHKLRNVPTNARVCITIQCYQYDLDDSAHYDYFDYVDADGAVKQYEPDSDMDYVAFKALMKEEWNEAHPPSSLWCCL